MDIVSPRYFVEGYAGLSHKEEIKKWIQDFKGDNSLCIGLECWGLKIPLSCPDVLCDFVVINDDGVHVLTFAVQSLPHVHQHAQTVATVLKNKFVTHGGFRHKFGVTSHVIDVLQGQKVNDWEKNILNRDLYPSHFSIHSKLDGLINSLVICMASYRARAQNSGSFNFQGSYNFILTHDQFELLWTQQFTKELWVHGPPGAGKTVAAIQLMQELRRRGCSLDNILYLAENEKLCDFVMSHNLCMVATRRTLLEDSNNTTLMQRRYSQICNVIVDEAQNFKDWDGDWYSLAEKLANQKAPEYLHRCSNYFWVFMDYSQKVHKFKAGLPSVIGKNNFMLSEVSRSTKEIFEFTSRLMMASENVDSLCNPFLRHVCSTPKLAHSFSTGRGVDILSCQESEITSMLSKVMSGLLKNGVKENDIAILVGRRSELDKIHDSLENLPAKVINETGLKEKGVDKEKGYICKIDVNEAEDQNKTVARNIGSSTNQDEISRDNDNERNKMHEGSVMSDSDSIEISNQFNVLSSSASQDEIELSDDDLESGEETHLEKSVSKDIDISSDTSSNKITTFYGQDSDSELNDDEVASSKHSSGFRQLTKESEDSSVAVDTVRGFSGLDKAAVIGINPKVNEEHADFNRFILSLASRARDNLVIITTSDNVKEELEKYTHLD